MNKEEKAVYMKAYRERNREKLKAQTAAYKVTHADAVKKKAAEYIAKHHGEIKAKLSAYGAAHRSEAAARRRKRFANCRDEERAYRADYYASHKQEASDYQKSYSAIHPEVVSANAAKRRARVKNAGGQFTASEFAAVCDKYGGNCIGPGPHSGKLTADHVVPLALGGSNDISNIQPLCKHCNCSKQDKTIDYRKD